MNKYFMGWLENKTFKNRSLKPKYDTVGNFNMVCHQYSAAFSEDLYYSQISPRKIAIESFQLL